MIISELTDKAAPYAAGSLLPSASADGLKGLEAKPLPLWALAPLWIIFKGVKTHIGTSKAGTIIYPSAEADGKRELPASSAGSQRNRRYRQSLKSRQKGMTLTYVS